MWSKSRASREEREGQGLVHGCHPSEIRLISADITALFARHLPWAAKVACSLQIVLVLAMWMTGRGHQFNAQVFKVGTRAWAAVVVASAVVTSLWIFVVLHRL